PVAHCDRRGPRARLRDPLLVAGPTAIGCAQFTSFLLVQGDLMRLGYNTNGLADHDIESAIEIVGSLGYTAIGITLDHHTLNPFGPRLEEELERVADRLKRQGLLPVIETGARYLLDKWRKHQPTLVSADRAGRERRIDFLQRAIDIAERLEAHAVSFWSGTPDDRAEWDVTRSRLCASLPAVLRYAADR